MSIINKLKPLRAAGQARTTGLADDIIERFAATDQNLQLAIDMAVTGYHQLREEFGDLLDRDEAELIDLLQSGFINFYADDAINPYISLAAKGPWLVTVKGAVLHDNGGYGMLGFGHAPQEILDVMSQPQVMANIMSPNFSQLRFARSLQREIGHRRDSGCPFDKFLCLNSGSESVTVAARISDINAKVHTDPDGRHAGKRIRQMSLSGGFHGRTDRPARYSHSTIKAYRNHLASYRDLNDLVTVEPNNLDSLRDAFAQAERDNVFIESMFMEPVMGEGNPGQAISPEFYALARELTAAHGSLLLVDSIQAGLRTHGVLSVVDYPGFEQLPPPDLETYSKALNGGQYPMSVLAMTASAAAIYRKGVYGNTMTAAPRALDIGNVVLNGLTDEIRQNIRDRGQEFLQKFRQLQAEMPNVITNVQGTGLLFSVELDSRQFKSHGSDSIEEYMRLHGINVIHGGENSLRYTPHFKITSAEIDLLVSATRQALLHGPVKAAAEAA
ncbi:MAG: aminotransferase class III-fold pyridoxal phosphate-dependent enzyme [Gammaproteobacteria bacterium]|nr:aminotransferase class III-fold pyridoxal phosphate-dependent enzyme [Gammaproteobacteria bacterium]